MVDIETPNNMEDMGNMIKDQLAESIKNVDVLSMLQKMVAETPEDEESEEIRQNLQGVLEQYNNMPESEKIQFVTQLKEILANKLVMKIQNSQIDMSGVENVIKDEILSHIYVVGAAILIFIAIFVFFGYKLYKSIKEKEKKREEKKKLKQMKKKK